MISATGISILVTLISLGWFLVLLPFFFMMMIPFFGIAWMGYQVYKFFEKINKNLNIEMPKVIILPIAKYPIYKLNSRLSPIPALV